MNKPPSHKVKKKAPKMRMAGERRALSASPKIKSSESHIKTTTQGAQTLVRGLGVLSAVGAGHQTLSDLSSHLSMNRSTTHRMASTLVELGYLSQDADSKYSLGPRLLELGYLAHNQRPLTRVARRHLQMLARETNYTVNLGCLEHMKFRYLDIVSSDRRVELKVHIGELQSVRNTAMGKALILDLSEAEWREYYRYEENSGSRYAIGLEDWIKMMRGYAEEGVALDLEENDDRIRCVAGPIRDASSKIVGAISVSSFWQYLNEDQMQTLKPLVIEYTQRISSELGFARGKVQKSK